MVTTENSSYKIICAINWSVNSYTLLYSLTLVQLAEILTPIYHMRESVLTSTSESGGTSTSESGFTSTPFLT